MPIKKYRNSQTGEEFLVEWDGVHEPTLQQKQAAYEASKKPDWANRPEPPAPYAGLETWRKNQAAMLPTEHSMTDTAVSALSVPFSPFPGTEGVYKSARSTGDSQLQIGLQDQPMMAIQNLLGVDANGRPAANPSEPGIGAALEFAKEMAKAYGHTYAGMGSHILADTLTPVGAALNLLPFMKGLRGERAASSGLAEGVQPTYYTGEGTGVLDASGKGRVPINLAPEADQLRKGVEAERRVRPRSGPYTEGPMPAKTVERVGYEAPTGAFDPTTDMTRTVGGVSDAGTQIPIERYGPAAQGAPPAATPTPARPLGASGYSTVVDAKAARQAELEEAAIADAGDKATKSVAKETADFRKTIETELNKSLGKIPNKAVQAEKQTLKDLEALNKQGRRESIERALEVKRLEDEARKAQAIADAKAGLEPKGPTISRTTKAGDETMVERWGAPEGEDALVAPSGESDVISNMTPEELERYKRLSPSGQRLDTPADASPLNTPKPVDEAAVPGGAPEEMPAWRRALQAQADKGGATPAAVSIEQPGVGTLTTPPGGTTTAEPGALDRMRAMSDEDFLASVRKPAEAQPVVAPPTATPAGGGRTLLPTQEESARQLDELLNALHGQDAPPVGNGALPVEPPAANAPDWVQSELDKLPGYQAAQDLSESLSANAPVFPPGMETNSSTGAVSLRDAAQNPRFSALPSNVRHERYQELGRIDKALRELFKAGEGSGGAGGSEAGIASPQVLAYLAKTLGGGAIGAQAGAASNPEHPVIGGVGGAMIGALGANAIPMLGTGGAPYLRGLERAAYEGMLYGAPQITNAIGNASAILTTPMVRALQGYPEEARQGFRVLANPRQMAKTFTTGWRTGYNEAPFTNLKFGEAARPIGPAGRNLHAVDAGTKAVLNSMGASPEVATRLTYSGDPATKFMAKTAMFQSAFPTRIFSPFARTGLNLLEVGSSLSPMRLLPGEAGASIRNVLPVNPNMSGMQRAIHEGAMAAPGALTFGLGVSGMMPSNPTMQASLGPLAAPAAIGNGIYDYAQYGKDAPGDRIQAVLNSIPTMDISTRLTTDPWKVAGNIAARPIPQILRMFGDHLIPMLDDQNTVHETGSGPAAITNSIGDALPGLRNQLPPRVNQFGEPLQRTPLGGYPQPLYRTDPTASVMADYGVLSREPSASLGGDSPQTELERAAIDTWLQSIPEPRRTAIQTQMAKMPTSLGNSNLSMHDQSNLQTERGHAIKQYMDAAIGGPGWDAVPENARHALLRMFLNRANQQGTDLFKAKRLAEPVQ